RRYASRNAATSFGCKFTVILVIMPSALPKPRPSARRPADRRGDPRLRNRRGDRTVSANDEGPDMPGACVRGGDGPQSFATGVKAAVVNSVSGRSKMTLSRHGARGLAFWPTPLFPQL